MSLIALHDRTKIEAILRRNEDIHFYSLGDLDDFFWPFTQWYAWTDRGEIVAICLLYLRNQEPVVLAIDSPENLHNLTRLFTKLLPILPPSFYGHLASGLEESLRNLQGLGKGKLTPFGPYLKMRLSHPDRIGRYLIDQPPVERLHPADAPEMRALLDLSYPDHAFDDSLIPVGPFFGVRMAGHLVSMGGIHVYSDVYKTASLGSITTHPDYRGRNYATILTAQLCHKLLETSTLVGLNVREDNLPARAVYSKLGFAVVGKYGEWRFTRNND